MKKKILTWLKKPFLLLYWFLKRVACRIPLAGKNLMKKRKRIYETNIEQLLKYRKDSPFNQISTPPWTLKVSGACLVLSKYVSSQIYHTARSDRWIEIFGFILGKRLGNLYIGITFFPVTNILRSSVAALPDLEHVAQFKREVASRFPDLEIVCTVHSHPNSILLPSTADKVCFLADDHPNIIVGPRRLLWGSPIKRLAAFYHSCGKVRKIKLFEINKEEPELEDMDFSEFAPSKEELLDVGELATEVDFGIYKIWIVSHPNVNLKRLSQKISELFGGKISFIPLFKDDDWVYDPEMKVVDFFMKDSEHLIFPEFFEEAE
jgi:proteasome lid subunit RPN8/RPN11